MSKRRVSRLVVLAATLLGVARAANGAARDFGGPGIDLTADRMVTVSVRNQSLRAVVEELCWRAGIAATYDAVDERVTADFRELSLEAALRRLLGTRPYALVTKTDGDSGTTRVTSLRVLGSQASARRADGRETAASPSFRIPTRLLEAAFGAGDAARRERAQRALVEGVTRESAHRAAFLDADATVMSAGLRSYPDARARLEEMRSGITDADVERKLDEILKRLD